MASKRNLVTADKHSSRRIVHQTKPQRTSSTTSEHREDPTQGVETRRCHSGYLDCVDRLQRECVGSLTCSSISHGLASYRSIAVSVASSSNTNDFPTPRIALRSWCSDFCGGMSRTKLGLISERQILTPDLKFVLMVTAFVSM